MPRNNTATRHTPGDDKGLRLDLAAIATYLEHQGLGLDRASGTVRLSGGLSNLNDLVTVDGRKMVLRRPPMGDLPPGAHDMAREHKILSRLSRAFPLAPDSYHLCEDISVIGVPFQLLEYRTGLVVRGDKLPACFSGMETRHALCEHLVRALAALHAVDAREIGLGAFGRPEGFFLRNVAGWRERAGKVACDQPLLDHVERIIAWLGDNEPRSTAPTLLHSDFKLDNCMLETDGRVSTLLDWDMGTRGDPLMDLATLISYWTEPDDPDCMHRLGQMPTAHPGFMRRADVLETYARLTGRDVDQFQSWRILAMLKLGIVFMQLYRNWVNGAIGDTSYAEFAQLGADLIEHTLDLLEAPL